MTDLKEDVAAGGDLVADEWQVPVLPAARPPGVFWSLIVICVSRQRPAYNHQL